MSTKTLGVPRSVTKAISRNPLMMAFEGWDILNEKFLRLWSTGGLPGASLSLFVIGAITMASGVFLHSLQTKTPPPGGLLTRSGLLLKDWLATLMSA